MKYLKNISLYPIILALTLTTTANAQTLDWELPLGGNYMDLAYAIEPTYDALHVLDGYIIVGETNSDDAPPLGTGQVSGYHSGTGSDMWVARTDTSGVILWERALGGSKNEIANDVQQTFDSLGTPTGYIVAGYTSSACAGTTDGDVSGNHGLYVCPCTYDYWVVKLSTGGVIEWQKAYGGTENEFAYAVQEIYDNNGDPNYLVVGSAESNDGQVTGHHGAVGTTKDVWLIKVDQNGNLLGQKSYGGAYDDIAYDIQKTNDGGCVITGSSKSADGDATAIVSPTGYFGHHGNPGINDDVWVLKLSSTGAVQWNTSLGGTLDDSGRAIQQTTDGGYIVVGITNSTDGNIPSGANHGSSDGWAVKLNSDGTFAWERCLGGSDLDVVYSVQQSSDGNYVIGGATNSTNGDLAFAGFHSGIGSDYWMMKLNAAGTSLWWSQCYGGSDSDVGMSIRQISSDGYIAIGYSSSTDGDTLLTLPQTPNHGSIDLWLIKITEQPTVGIAITKIEDINIFPNPVVDWVNITFDSDVTDASVTISTFAGQLLRTEKLNTSFASFNMSDYAKGVYFLTIQGNKNGKSVRETKQIVVQK